MPGEIHHIRQGRDGSYPVDGSPRRLAAIVAADISGYSRLMAMDEEGTHARVKRHRRELIDPTIIEHHGRLVKSTGDGFLAMFDSPVEAVRCAIVIQQSMVGRNAALPREQWIQYRIGVNLGDVIVEPDDIYGDGVNIAARLEGIADPGDLFISGGVYEQIKHKLVCGYQSLGDRQVKNITDPVRVYRVLPDPAAVIKARPMPGLALAVILSACLVAGAAAATATWYYFVWQPKHLAAERSPGQTPGTTKSPVHRRCSAGGTGDQARDAVVICSSPAASRCGSSGTAARNASDQRTRNGDAPRGHIRNGQQRRPVRKTDPSGQNQILCHRQVPGHSARVEPMRCRQGMYLQRNGQR